VGSPGSSWGFGPLLKGLTSVVDSQPQSFLLLCIEKLHLTERQLFYNRTLKSHCETEYSQIHAKSVIDGQKNLSNCFATRSFNLASAFWKTKKINCFIIF